ncbi:hypothetical protein CHARACLAT_027389 [Characodon lateralis]|uniref:Uncharacterized protein n=1 Tax=Characodon lateralis TaxID=208331 RepID=A0ABU7EMW7_9TELE|nr:hypothetical protein [Characodon lateralis]
MVRSSVSNVLHCTTAPLKLCPLLQILLVPRRGMKGQRRDRFFRDAHLSGIVWRRAERNSPNSAIQPKHKGDFTGRKSSLLLFFLATPYRIPVPFPFLPHPHWPTHSQAVISMLMGIQGNTDEKQRECCAENTERGSHGNGSVSTLSEPFSWLTRSEGVGDWTGLRSLRIH